MMTRERQFIAAVLLVITFMVGADLATDSREGVTWWHLFAEGLTALTAALGVFFLLRDSFTLKRSLEVERSTVSRLESEGKAWQAQSKKYIEGLSQAIDQQLAQWQLSHSEREVAFLLLKGLSFKEIAEIRNTSEKTARTQSTAIYSKAGLAGRSELAAFFLEDLLPPSEARGEDKNPS